MGAWSSQPLSNDAALDLAVKLSEASNLRQFRDRLIKALRGYDSFEVRRTTGANVTIWTEAEVQKALRESGFTPENIDDPRYAGAKKSIYAMLGKTTVDTGADPAFEAIAAAAIMLASCRNERDAVRRATDTPLQLLDGYKPTKRDVAEAIRVVSLIPTNKALSRNCGAVWARNVKALTAELAALAS